MNPLTQPNFPNWAKEKANELKQLEIHLGHLPKEKDWDMENLEALQKRVSQWQEADVSEEKTEVLFSQIVLGLTKEGFELEQICQFINEKLASSHGGPSYCDLEEVKAALHSGRT